MIDARDLPTFADIWSDAYEQLGDVEDTLGSDWRPGAGPTPAQAMAVDEARQLIAAAKAAMKRAAR